ncbi:hypothetical protein MKW98_016527 [Papaver atlanticum]|uniref:Uncharacterized protein n=1 Tax=Papaver atlanticum TaxID=357466 RepID=A0AAD4RZ85_9MAGN|nr:hypothetical protein MKW98_016527 [Papaver atlanticum]
MGFLEEIGNDGGIIVCWEEEKGTVSALKFSIRWCYNNVWKINELSKKKASLGGLDTLERVEDLRQMLQRARETNNMVPTLTSLDIIPATKAIVEMQYFHHHATVTSAVGLNQSPAVDDTSTVAGYGTSAGALTKYNAGISPTNPYYKALSLPTSSNHKKYGFDRLGYSIIGMFYPVALCMTLSLDFIFRFDKGYTPIASYVHHLDALRTTNENTITVGGLYAVDPLTYVKYRLNNQGKLDGLMQHELKLKSILTPRPWIRLPGSGCPLLSSLK